MSKDVQPIFIMPEGTQRSTGKTAQRNNIMAAKLVAETVRTTLGPKGMDKMLVDSLNDVSMAEPVTMKDISTLKKVAMTAMVGKSAESAKELLADITFNAVKNVSDEFDGDLFIDDEDIKIEKKVGGRVEDTELVKGIVLDKEKVHSAMPRRIESAKIALVDSPLEIKNTEIDAKIQITDPSQLQSFLDMEEKMLKDMVAKIEASGANVVFCQKGIDDLAQHYLSKKGIYACRRVKKSDMEKLAKATGASIVTNLDDLSAKDLGKSGIVEELKVGDEEMTFVRECRNPKSVTILVKGSTEHVVDEVTRAIDDAVGGVIAALRSRKVVAGAASTEVELSKALRKFADSLSGREQLAVMAFADAMDIIPRTLAENAGLDPIDVVTELKAAHDKQKKWAGINVFTGKVMDAWQSGVIEPLKIKTQAISSASEVAIMILRIDDVIAGGPGGEGPMPPPGAGGMPPGMPGMGM